MSNPYAAITASIPKKHKTHKPTREERLEEDLISILDELREIAKARHDMTRLCAACGAFLPRR